ncbi:hypothetical protein W03_24280 [Nitrosomonas sp. PY1]|uniref:hypothetical protein n=1 Tax=Nitrosomonas sp. PY1 TaxID=1803906 RepID=UPI001FC82A21|nr:hypothetical protein [Nitrosomonas sp. PY1]GKS70424.1 hypothetical protein W03_24280 [Nitrosomonas sp. PY1]
MQLITTILISLGAILFLSGVAVYALLGMQRINTIKIFGKSHQLWRFVIVTVGSGIALIVLSALLNKHVLYESADKSILLTETSDSLKYELKSILAGLKIDTPEITNAIKRFQSEYLAAFQDDNEKTMELLSLEMSYRIRTALAGLEYPEKQIEREVEQIMNLLKQQQSKK